MRAGRRKGGELAATAGYGTGAVGAGGKKKNKMGMGTELAVGAAAGVFGGLARVEDNLEREDSYEKRRRRRLRGVAVKVLAAGYGSR